jgi:transposase
LENRYFTSPTGCALSFNPIEMAFADLKALLREDAARTVPDLWEAIAATLDAFTPVECQAYFVARI